MNISEVEKKRLKKRAHEIAGQNGGMSWECYQQAHAEYLMATIEGDDLTVGEHAVLTRLKALSSNGKPVSTTRLAVELGGWNYWKTWDYLSRLESKRLVQRPDGPKSGWWPV